MFMFIRWEISQRGLSPAAQCTSGSPLIWGEDVDELRLMKPGLDWPRVADLLDHDGLVVDATGFALLAALYRRGAGHQLPISSFISYLWRNIPGQISMIQGSVSCPPDVYSFAAGRVLSLEGLEGLSGTMTPWISLDLLQMLCVLTENDHYSSVRAILEFPVKSYPEILLLGFVQCSALGEWGILQREVFGSLFPVFLDNFASPNSTTVLRRVWLLSQVSPHLFMAPWRLSDISFSQTLMLEILVQYYSHDVRSSLPRIIDICQDLGALSAVLDSTPFIFSIDVACAALSRGLVDLSSWLQNKMSEANPLLFLQSLIRFLDQKLPSEGEAMGQISLEAATSCLMVLHQSISAGAVPSEVISEVKRVQAQAVQFFPSLASMPPTPDQFASDVEEEANRYFRSIYAENKPIAEVVEALARYKDSSVVREQEVFACMINNLFDEYRFFPRYPDKELHITATLFGAMIQKQLISSLTLGVALRYVLDALGKPLGSKMSTFGLDALAQFRLSLPLWPQFCAELLQTPLKDADPGEMHHHVTCFGRQS
jgi:CCR4-NOT transcription complex subunit 1